MFMPLSAVIMLNIKSLSGGDDKLLKLWHYSDGEVTHVGVGHSGSITNVRICPNSRCIVSTSADGAILRWRYPQTLNHE